MSPIFVPNRYRNEQTPNLKTYIFFILGVSKIAWVLYRVAQCIDKEILIGENCNIDIGIDIDKENFEKLIIY